MTDGGSEILSYEVDWDTNPGVREVQTITTSTYLGPNEIQEVVTSATTIEEIQFVTTNATQVAEVQSVTVSGATSGYFYLELDTTAFGGSMQLSGYIGIDYPANGSYLSVATILSVMSNIAPYGAVNVSLVVIDASTYSYLVTFPMAMGNVPQMVVHTAQLLTPTSSSAVVTTLLEGNVIGGSFNLIFQGAVTAAIPFNADPFTLQQAIEALPGIGTVDVIRSGPSPQLGYTWAVTFTSPINSGNVDNMIPDYTNLTVTSPGAAAMATVTSIDGNQLGGSFILTYSVNGTSNATLPIPFDASAVPTLDFSASKSCCAIKLIASSFTADNFQSCHRVDCIDSSWFYVCYP